MKKSILILPVILLFLVPACKQQQAAGFDPDLEKNAIQALFDENVRVLMNNKPDELIAFMRKYDLPSNYIVYQDSIFFNEEAKKSDDELLAYLLPAGFHYTRFEFTRPLTISFSNDGSMASVIAQFLVEVEYTAEDGIRRMPNTYTVLQILKKVDGVWMLGDYMQYIGE